MYSVYGEYFVGPIKIAIFSNRFLRFFDIIINLRETSTEYDKLVGIYHGAALETASMGVGRVIGMTISEVCNQT